MNEGNLRPLEAGQTPNYELVRLEHNDIADLIQESQHAFLQSVKSPDETTESLINKLMSDPTFEIFGYMVGQQAISYIVGLDSSDGLRASIGPMYVSKEYRGFGLGKAQVADFLEVHNQRGFVSFYTKTWSENKASRRTFEQLGFIQIARKENDRVNGDATIEYQLTHS